MDANSLYDVIIIGGGPAGLQAALTLGRARRRVLVCDIGAPRNARAPASHNTLTRDGVPPLEILRIGRTELEHYPTVELLQAEVLDARREERGFVLEIAERGPVRARRVILATGMRDRLPEIEGLAPLWGRSVYVCPYCHGYEVRDAPLAFRARGEEALHYGVLLRGWSRQLTLVSDGDPGLDAAGRQRLLGLGIRIIETPIARLEASGDLLEAIRFVDGQALPCRALFLRPPQEQRSDLALRLGARLTEQQTVEVSQPFLESAVPGLHVAGDASQMMPSIVQALASGQMAAAGVNHILAQEDAAEMAKPGRGE